jgi:hypothetical protein
MLTTLRPRHQIKLCLIIRSPTYVAIVCEDASEQLVMPNTLLISVALLTRCRLQGIYPCSVEKIGACVPIITNIGVLLISLRWIRNGGIAQFQRPP